MQVIGITGGIGAGKSVVSRILRCRGYAVYDCDFEARMIMDASDDLKSAVVGRFGAGCVDGEGMLDRKEIARYVFGDDGHRLWLNSLVHSMVRDDIVRRLADAPGPLFFVESAILRTSGLSELCDAVWIVEASEDIRLSRACMRDNTDERSVKARIDAQREELAGFRGSAVDVVFNDGLTPLLPQIDNLLNKI